MKQDQCLFSLIQARELFGNELFVYLMELGENALDAPAVISQQNGGTNDA